MTKCLELWGLTKEEVSDAIAVMLRNKTAEDLDGVSELGIQSLRDLANRNWPSLHNDVAKLSGGIIVRSNVYANRQEIPRRVGYRVEIFS